MHFFHCPNSQAQYIRRHDHIRDAIIDQIGDAIRPDEDPYDIEVERKPLARAHLPPSPADPPPAPPGEEAMAAEPGPDARLAEDSDDIACSALTGLGWPSGTSTSAI